MEQIKEYNYLLTRIRGLIKLRWLAVIGIIGIALLTDFIVDISLPFFHIYFVAILLGIYNFLLLHILQRLKEKIYENSVTVRIIINFQISLDLLALAFLIHFSGGVENPFMFYFIFHMIIAGILLKPKDAFFQAVYAVGLFFLIVFLEKYGVVRHFSLWGDAYNSLHNTPSYIGWMSFVFTSTLFIAVYMASSISGQLKKREKSLKRANMSLKEKDRIKSEYVLKVTHDIKGDLSAIYSCIEPVAEGVIGSLSKEQKNLLQRAKKRSEKLIFFVNDLLDITKLKLMKKSSTEEFSFLELIKDVLENIIPRAKMKKIKFETDIEISSANFRGVKVYIKEILLNLLVNSLNYTPVGGKINFSVKDKEDLVKIEITDTGIGIAKEDLPYVFEEFYRGVNASSLEKQGTGLGLSMAKQIVEMHKGKIRIESEGNEGTRVFVELSKEI